MGLENIRCFECQKYGHLAKDCPEIVYAEEITAVGDKSKKPPWCGQCDKRTRTQYDPKADRVRRCPACNPEKELPKQFLACKCGSVIYRWDKSGCGNHQPVGERLSPIGARK